MNKILFFKLADVIEQNVVKEEGELYYSKFVYMEVWHFWC